MNFLNETENLPIDKMIIMLIFSMAKSDEDNEISYYNFNKLICERI
jgi:hypothetical protein